MNIDFTKEQYERLMKLVYLGDWMINAIRSGRKGDERIEKYEEIQQYIYSFAKDFELADLIEYDETRKQFFPTNVFDEDSEIEKYLEDYDGHTFWEELFYRIYERDFEKAYTQKEISRMDMEELFAKEEPFRQKWDDEFLKHGIDRLEIKEK